MSETDWLQVVLDYGKRFPNSTMNSLGLNVYSNKYIFDISELTLHGNGYLALEKKFYCFNYFKIDLEFYYWDDSCEIGHRWKLVPDHIKLRLLTEGKEDLI